MVLSKIGVLLPEVKTFVYYFASVASSTEQLLIRAAAIDLRKTTPTVGGRYLELEQLRAQYPKSSVTEAVLTAM